MAGDAALRLRELLAEGEEIPYEVREAGAGSPLAEYIPQTSRFIRDHASELSASDSFGTTCAALESAGLAAAYLEEMGVPTPTDDRRRGELAGVVFLCRMWQGSTDFTLDDSRLHAAMDELLELGEVAPGEIEIAVPLRGFQMPVERLELAAGTIVRADAVEVPTEARSAEGMGGAGWEPNYLAIARVDAVGGADDGSDLGLRAVAAFKRVVTTLRLFKPGGVSLGPYAWIRSSGDRWRRIGTGAGKPRPGGYRLADTELAELAGFSRALAAENAPFGRLDQGRKGFPAILERAISRFEAGLDRPVTVEALNDYLLTLRFLLEGGGPASLGMPMRVAALCADPDGRTEVKATVDHAIALERELWSGEPSVTAERRPPAEIAAEVENLTRAILADAACGHLGNELRTTADEILLGEGLAVGEGAAGTRGETAEWNPADNFEFEDLEGESLEQELEAAMGDPSPTSELEAEPESEGHPEPGSEPEPEFEPEPQRQGTPRPAHNPIVAARAQNLIHEVAAAEPEFDWEEPTPRSEREPDAEPVTRVISREAELAESEGADAEVRILRAVPDEGPVADLIANSDEHRRQVATRVSFLFPPPETTEWQVREVGYDRTRRAEISDPAEAS